MLALGKPAYGFGHDQAEDDGKGHPREADDDKGRAPAVEFVDPAAKEKPEKHANVDAHGVDGQGRGAPFPLKYIGDDGVGWGASPASPTATPMRASRSWI